MVLSTPVNLIGFFFYGLPVLLPLAYLAWRVTWAPQLSSKPGWVLIVVMAALWALMFGWGLLVWTLTPSHGGLGDSLKAMLPWLACGAVVGMLALELWSRQRLHQRVGGKPALEAKLVWRILLALSLVVVWIPVGDRIWYVVERYHGTHYDYGLKVYLAIWRGVLGSTAIYAVLGLVRNAVGLARSPSRAASERG